MLNAQTAEKARCIAAYITKDLKTLMDLINFDDEINNKENKNEPISIGCACNDGTRVIVHKSSRSFISTALMVEAEELQKQILEELDHMRELLILYQKEDEMDDFDRFGDDSVD